MCLYTKDSKPRIAERDIVCFKVIESYSKGKYRTPYMKKTIKLNSLIKAYPKNVSIENIHNLTGDTLYKIDKGVIHAFLLDICNKKGVLDIFKDRIIKKAIIPKGTEYYLGVWGEEIAAKEMYISDEEGFKKDLNVQFLKDLLEEAPSCNGIRVGDYYTSKGEFIHPKRRLTKSEIIGIVVGFHNEVPLISALDIFKNVSIRDIDEENLEYINYISKPIPKIMYSLSKEEDEEDFNGRKYTEEYYNLIKGVKDKKNLNKEEAFIKCLQYEKNGFNNWYLPATGELIELFNNVLYINLAYAISGLGYYIQSSESLWTSSIVKHIDTKFTPKYLNCILGYFQDTCKGYYCYIRDNAIVRPFKYDAIPFLDYK